MNANVNFFNELMDKGNEEFEFIFRTLVKDDNPALYALIEDNTPAFYEPLLASYYNPQLERKYSLMQILLGYVMDTTYLLNNPVALKTDDRGILYVPKMGYFYTDKENSTLLLSKADEDLFVLEDADKNEVQFEFAPVVFLAGSDIELNVDSNAIIDQFFPDPKGLKYINESALTYQTELEEALNLIRVNFPFYYEWLENSVVNIVIFDSDQRNSFASMFIKGAAFINVRNQTPSTMFFLEEITHQCGHVIFYPMSIDRQSHFTCDCETPMSEFTGIEGDDRDVLNAFYAFFPQLYGDLIFDETLDKGLVQDRMLLDELMGRFAFRMYKYGLGVTQFDAYKELLSDYGYAMFTRFKDGYNEILAKRQSDFDAIDVSNQVYVFDVPKFFETNQHLTEKI